MDALGINLGFFLFQVFNFIIVMLLLSAWAYGPVVKMLEQRREQIAQGLEDARVAAEARANAENEAKKIIADAQTEANKRLAEVAAREEKVRADILAAANADKARILKEAQEQAAEERTRILGDLRSQVAALAVAAANKVIGEALDEKRQHALINEFFSGVKAGKVTVLESLDAGNGAAEVTSALPLTNDEQTAVKKDLTAKLGSVASITFKVDPTILGGLVVRVGDKIVDASVAGKLEGLRANLH